MVISNPAWRFSSASNRPAMALLNVSGIRFGDSSASPRPMPAPAKVNDGRIVRWSRAPRPVRKASTRRSHSPAEAVSSMTSHLRALARSPNTVSHHGFSGSTSAGDEHNAPWGTDSVIETFLEIADNFASADEQGRFPSCRWLEWVFLCLHVDRLLAEST